MLVLIVCFVWGCKSDDPTRPEMTVGSLSGLVVDSKDQPLEGMAIGIFYGLETRKAAAAPEADSGVEFSFSVAGSTTVTLDILDPSGQRVRRFGPELYEPGQHSLVWNGTDDEGEARRNGIYRARATFLVGTDEQVEEFDFLLDSDDPSFMARAPHAMTDADGRFEISLDDLPLDQGLQTFDEKGVSVYAYISRTVVVVCIDPDSSPVDYRYDTVNLRRGVKRQVKFVF
jgi:hypothetical protein